MVIGITGPIGSGKSYICSKFSQYPKFDIDSYAKQFAIKYKDEFDFIFQYYGLQDSQKEYSKLFKNKKLYKDYMLLMYDYLEKELDNFKLYHPDTDIIVEGVNLYFMKNSIDLLIFVKTNFIKRLTRLIHRDHKKHKLNYILKKAFNQKHLIKNYKNMNLVYIKN